MENLSELLKLTSPETFIQNWNTYEDTSSIGKVTKLDKNYKSEYDLEYNYEKIETFDYIYYFEKYDTYIAINMNYDSYSDEGSYEYEEVIPITKTITIFESKNPQEKIKISVKREIKDDENEDDENDNSFDPVIEGSVDSDYDDIPF